MASLRQQLWGALLIGLFAINMCSLATCQADIAAVAVALPERDQQLHAATAPAEAAPQEPAVPSTMDMDTSATSEAAAASEAADAVPTAVGAAAGVPLQPELTAAAAAEATTAAVAPPSSGAGSQTIAPSAALPTIPAGQPLSTTYAGIQAAANARLQAAQAASSPQAVSSFLPRPAITLPACPANSKLLLPAPGGLYPKNWATLQPQVQSMHPINLAMMHLASVSNAEQASQISTCLAGWGAVAESIRLLEAPAPGYSAGSNAVVFRTSSDIFISFRATDDDWVINADCQYTPNLRSEFPGTLTQADVRLHRGFWAAYSALHPQLVAAVQAHLNAIKAANPSSSPQIFIAGHSLGGALAGVAALKLHTSAAFKGMVGGVWTFGAPRVGNAGWKDSYNNYLLPGTLRMQGQFDWASTLPAQVQVCMPTVAGNGANYTFGHVGRAVVLCRSSVLEGLQRVRLFPTGTEGRCSATDPTQFDSHLMSHYFDGWLRAWYDLNKSFSIAQHPIMVALRCRDCVSPLGRAILSLPDNRPIRGDALVTCSTLGSCVRRPSWQAVTQLGSAPLVPYSPLRLCDLTFKCVP